MFILFRYFYIVIYMKWLGRWWHLCDRYAKISWVKKCFYQDKRRSICSM